MRILQLNLIAFGPFTDCQLDLSAGQEGLHVIYGPNEAGKSSALRAISDLFFGIHVRTSDNFVHPYPKLHIGARIQHSDGSVLDCIRRKGNQNTLRGDDDTTPLDDEQLIHYLGNVDRDLFHTMFGIDHERLRRGGAEIVQGGGRLGELLFAAGAGLADLHDVQQRLQTDIEKLFKSTGRSGSIVSGVKDYQDALLAVKSSQVSVDTWRHHDENLQLAESQKHTLDATIRKLRSDQNRLLRIRNSLPAIARWKKASEEIAAFSETPILPDEFEDTSHAAIVELRKSEQQQRDAENDLTGLNQQLESTLVPTHILAESDAIEALRDRLGGYRKAMSDLPNLETSREIAEGEATEILRVLNRAPNLEKIEELRLPADKTVRIQDLGNQKEALSERLQSARRDCEKLRRTIQRSEEKLQVIHIPAAVGELRETTRQIQLESDLETQLLTNTATLESLLQEASLKIQQLTLWDGSIDLAEALPVPTPATLDRFDLEFNKVRADIQSLRDRAEEENSAIQELDEQLGKLELEQSVPTVDELAQLRSTRDQGWQLVLRAWREHLESSQDVDEFVKRFSPLQNLADAFARSVQDADQVADRLRNDADRVAKKATWQAERDRAVVVVFPLAENFKKQRTERTTWTRNGMLCGIPLKLLPPRRQKCASGCVSITISRNWQRAFAPRATKFVACKSDWDV